jgi:hypothetical protein
VWDKDCKTFWCDECLEKGMHHELVIDYDNSVDYDLGELFLICTNPKCSFNVEYRTHDPEG